MGDVGQGVGELSLAEAALLDEDGAEGPLAFRLKGQAGVELIGGDEARFERDLPDEVRVVPRTHLNSLHPADQIGRAHV